jgi:gas vesicle protein
MNKTKKRRRNNALLLLTGAIAGAAATYYLNTPKGKKMTKEVMKKGKDLGNTITDKAQSIAEDAKDKANKVIENAAETLSAAKDLILKESNELVEEVESHASSFKSGIKKAKESMKNGERVS